MLDFLTKPIDQITVSDIQSLINLRVQEDQYIEFKGSGRESDRKYVRDWPWTKGQQEISEKARNKILEEAVAFANAQGGVLFLGIEESSSSPPVAECITPIPKCADFVKRLQSIFINCVEPRLILPEIHPVETCDDDRGVVIIRINKSRLAPHRVIPTKSCPIRRADRCNHMTMYEVQELTLNVTRGLVLVDHIFAERSTQFQQEFGRLSTPEAAFGIRMTAVPVDDQVRINRVYENGQIIQDFCMPSVEIQFEGTGRDTQYLMALFLDSRDRAVVRGARRERVKFPPSSSDPDMDVIIYSEVRCDGLIEIGYICASQLFRDSNVDPDWLLGLFAHLLGWVEKLREHSSGVGVEYAIEVETRCVGDQIVYIGSRSPHSQYYQTLFRNEGRSDDRLKTLTFPRPRYSFMTNEVVKDLLILFQRDFLNSVGRDPKPEQEIFDLHITY